MLRPSFCKNCVTLDSYLNLLSLCFLYWGREVEEHKHVLHVGTIWTTKLRECSTGLALPGSKQRLDRLEKSLLLSTRCSSALVIQSDIKLIFWKKSKVYWNFKLHLKNQNPNPGDIQQDKVSESGKCSLSQNLLTQASWVHFSRPRRDQNYYSSRLPQDSILWLIPKFPTRT